MKLQSAILFIVWLLTGGSLAFGDTSRFEGRWSNPQSQGITSVEIRNVNGALRLHAFGRCQPQDCDWGEAAAQTYAPGVDQRYKDTVEALSAEFQQGFAHVLLVLYPAEGNRLRIETFTVFTDSSGRLPYHKVGVLERSAAEQPAATPDLVEPVQLSPASGSVFSAYPRVTTLQWSAVPGAARYGVEVDCYHCCQRDKWCSEVGGDVRSAVVDGLTYTFNFVGAKPGRWRVWALAPGGEAGPKSDWRDFRYER